MSQPKIWFVTGASRGFGHLWTRAALERGDKVAATARDAASLDGLVADYGDAVLALPLDVTDREAVFAAVGEAHRHFGRLDVVLCNAGYGYLSAVEEIVPAEARANLDTNVFGTLSVIQAALPLLRAQRGGHILTMSSIGGIVSAPTGGIYLATKFAVEALTEALAGEVAGFGVKATIIEPGAYTTNFTTAMRSAPKMTEYDEVRRATEAGFNPGMMGDPAATAGTILKLVDAEEPPLRLLLGDWLLPMIKQVYQARLETWDKWSDVSNAAQGQARS